MHTPEGGGGTHFPNLNLTISPKKGSALLWPNVMDHDLAQSDHRTMHEALPPTAGLKYSSNLWLHQYDFQRPNTHGCDMGKRVDRSAFKWPTSDEALAERTNRTTGWPTIPPVGASPDELDHVENDEL